MGGGLAGLAAAAALCERGFHVEIFEARRYLGGRAGSFFDSATGRRIDHCQHVAMGCCTHFLDFCRSTGVDHLFRQDEMLHFFSPEGQRHDMRASWWLPAPLHLAPSLWRLSFLSRPEKIGIARAMWRLARSRNLPETEPAGGPTMSDWLRGQGQSPRAIERFWAVVLISALGESLDRASLAAARKVFVDGFLARRNAWHVYVPQAPLGEIYEDGIGRWLRERGAEIHLGRRIKSLQYDGRSIRSFVMDDDSTRRFDAYVLAVPWKQLGSLLTDELRTRVFGDAADEILSLAGSPITSLHLWFDRPVSPLPHAVLIDRLTQWVFNHGKAGCESLRGHSETGISPDPSAKRPAAYYQAVISASRGLAGREREDVLGEVLGDLAAIFPEAKHARLLHWRMITHQDAVFSYRPGLDRIRPSQATPLENLFLAGDWTATGWPSTMESAVRSGYLAAEAIAGRYASPPAI